MVNSKYDRAIFFIKRDNLLQWYNNVHWQTAYPEEYYAKTRDIQLILLLRYEGGKIFAKIKCPINPLPVRGEFEIPSTTAIYNFLTTNGWCVDKDIHLRIFE